ncbi:SGNH/GDSL hydrolase family protein [Salinactinospora qingdaonensis]|uniref:GDSL-like Lipase/Acylhydrolase family protein n=1 Tax=Salinactinospora qingdaonensis TaxID=702744 RepID=A0ABP7FRL7_9ACTN
MPSYDEAFSDSGEINWTPYTIFFHPRNYSSPVVNTDRLGFRLSTDAGGRRVSLAEYAGPEPVNIMAGSSTTFGIGASSDATTLASLLSEAGPTWLNFGGRSFNAIQEYLLLALHQHLLPPVGEIVLLSGFNNLGLARQPVSTLGEHGTFFMHGRYERLREQPTKLSSILRGSSRADHGEPDTARLPLDEQIEFAITTTARALELWSILARHLGARLTYVLQPLANWVRENPCPEEAEIFAELDEVGGFTEMYGEILAAEVHTRYSRGLEQVTNDLGIRYVDSVPLFAESLKPEDWAYVDRIHFTDEGHRTFTDLLTSVI